MKLTRVERLQSWTARCTRGGGALRLVIRVNTPDLRKVVPEDDLIARMRAHFRNGERDKDTMIVGAAGVLEFQISEELDRYLTQFMAGNAVMLERFAQATVLANAAVAAVMGDLVTLPDGVTPATAAEEWQQLGHIARKAVLTTLNVAKIRTQAHSEVRGDLHYEMLAEITAETLRSVSEEGPLSLFLEFALMDACVSALKFQAKQQMLAKAKSRRKSGGPKTTEIGVIKR